MTRWPDGLVCRPCQRKALHRRGVGPSCRVERLLPGRRGDAAICRDCAGITRDFACARCGVEALPHLGGRCAACVLDERLRQLLDDGTGRIRPELQPLATLLADTGNVENTLRWTRRPNGSTLLRELASGELELSHAALNTRGQGQTTTYVRGLLVAAGVLPDEDPVLVHFERWLTRRLAGLAGHPCQQVLRQFGLWHQLPRMRTKAAGRRLPAAADLYARAQFKAAQSFLTWLGTVGIGLAHVSQADLDRWFEEARRGDRDRCRGFLTWAMTTRLMPAGQVPPLVIGAGPGITQTERLNLLRRCAEDTGLPLAPRVAAMLVVLFGQPLTRIRTLTVDDVIDGEDVTIRLGDPPSPVPQPFAALLLELCANRDNLSVAANASCRWLFPGRGPGQPIGYNTLRRWVTSVGLHVGHARVTALRQLVLDVPAPVVATALGFAHFTAHRHVTAAGGVWNRYAAPSTTP